METKRSIFTLCFSLLFVTAMVSQDLIQYPAPILELQMEQSGGKNGVAVVFNPDEQLYYCAIAGNASFPLETFDLSGKIKYQSRAYNDIRGLWWNPKEKALEGNCYSDGGIVSIGLTAQGFAGTGNKIVFQGGEHQPDAQSVGTYDPKKKEILYYENGAVIGYSRKDGSQTGTRIWLKLPVDESNINWTTLVFTGMKKMELGVLDTYNNRFYLFNRKDGSLAGTVHLPSGATTYEAFNFSYANDHVFLFDQDTRTWTGYRVF